MPLSAGSLINGWEKLLTRNCTLTFGWLHTGLHDGRRCDTRWMKLRLKIFTQWDIVSVPCETPIKEETPPVTVTSKSRRKDRVSGGKRFGHVRVGWRPSMHMYEAALCVQTYVHVCIAALTGSGFSSLSSVFISDGCTPLRLTPYATHRRLNINQTSRIYAHKTVLTVNTHTHATVSVCIRLRLHRNPLNRPVSLTSQAWGTKTNRRMGKRMTGWHDAWEPWMANGDHIVMNAGHIVVDAQCWHWWGNSER